MPQGAHRSLTVLSFREELVLLACQQQLQPPRFGAAPVLPLGGGGGCRTGPARGEGGSDPSLLLGTVQAAHCLERVAQRVACALEHRLAVAFAAEAGAAVELVALGDAAPAAIGVSGAAAAAAAPPPTTALEAFTRRLEEEPSGEEALRYRRAARRAIGLLTEAGKRLSDAGGGQWQVRGGGAGYAAVPALLPPQMQQVQRLLAALRKGVGKDSKLRVAAAAVAAAAAASPFAPRGGAGTGEADAAREGERRALADPEREMLLEALRALPGAPLISDGSKGPLAQWWGAV